MSFSNKPPASADTQRQLKKKSKKVTNDPENSVPP